MKMRLTFLFITLLLYQCMGYTQTLKLNGATELDWAGGIAGHTGENYTFEIEFINCQEEPIPIMIWIGKYAIKLTIDDSIANNNTIINHKKGTGIYNYVIKVGTFHNEYAQREGMPTEDELLDKVDKPPIAYKGKALLSYSYQGRYHTYIIPEIITHLPNIDAP